MMFETPPPDLLSTHSDIATLVESILRSIIKAQNARNFDTSSPPWTSVAANYRIDCPHNRWRQNPKASRSAWVQSLEDFSKEYPELHITIDCLMTSVSQNSGHARAFMEFRVTGGPGFPPGVMSKPAMSMWEFQYLEVEAQGRWMLVKETTVSGAPVCAPWMDGEVAIWGGG